MTGFPRPNNLRAVSAWQEKRRIEINHALALHLAELAKAKKEAQIAFGRKQALAKISKRTTLPK